MGPEESVFEVVLADGQVEEIGGATAYVLEGPLTTFFRSARNRATIDAWSERLASFRTADIRRIIRRDTASRPPIDETDDEDAVSLEAAAS